MACDAFGFPIERDWAEIDAAGMAAIDLLMIGDLGVGLVQMMENAGRALATLALRRFLSDAPRGKRVAVLAGAGGNGGGAMTAARRLVGWGAEITLVPSGSLDSLALATASQLRILERMGVRPEFHPPRECDLIVDGLVGYSLNRPPRGRVVELIDWANAHSAPTLALDSPSGFDASEGRALDSIVRASATLTLALPKRGMTAAHLREAVGALYLADISVPSFLYGRLAKPLKAPPFERGDIVRLLTRGALEKECAP